MNIGFHLKRLIVWMLCCGSGKLTNGVDVENGSSSVDNSNLHHVISQLSNLSFQNSGPKRTIKLAIFPDNYDKTIIPPLEQGKAHTIQATVEIFSIPTFDEKKEEIMLEVRVTHLWTDSRLLTAELAESVELEPEGVKDLWTPDSYFARTKSVQFIKLITPTASLRIYRNQTIRYSEMMMLTVGCPMNFHHYPMDKQKCALELQSFGYDVTFNTYEWYRPPKLHKNIILDNHDVAIEAYNDTYISEGGRRFPVLGLKIKLERHIMYHLTLTYIPSIIFVVVAWISFLVPSDVVPGRMVLCVTTLLTLTSMFNSVRTLTPQVSYMKAIDLWVLGCILFVFSTLAEYGLVLYLTSRSAWQKRVDTYIKEHTQEMNAAVRLKIIRLLEVEKRHHEEKRKKSKSGATNYNNTAFVGPERTYPHSSNDIYMSHLSLKDTQDFLRKGTAIINMPQTNQPKEEAASAIRSLPKLPVLKERYAYKVEFGAKIVYPICFIIFNIVYWSTYSHRWIHKI